MYKVAFIACPCQFPVQFSPLQLECYQSTPQFSQFDGTERTCVCMHVWCELVLPVNMYIVRCNFAMILCRFDLRYKLLASVNMLCACA